MTSVLRPIAVPGIPLTRLAASVNAPAADGASIPDVGVSGVTLRAQDAVPGDLFAALPGATVHGAQFAGQAVAAGAVAVLLALSRAGAARHGRRR